MVENKNYIPLNNLSVYKLARNLSRISWGIYEKLDWQPRKIMGNQFIESTDSVSANIAEGYGRFHYLDKVKFYYNARGSLLESRNWLDLLKERKFLRGKERDSYLKCYQELRLVLNALISSVMMVKKKG